MKKFIKFIIILNSISLFSGYLYFNKEKLISNYNFIRSFQNIDKRAKDKFINFTVSKNNKVFLAKHFAKEKNYLFSRIHFLESPEFECLNSEYNYKVSGDEIDSIISQEEYCIVKTKLDQTFYIIKQNYLSNMKKILELSKKS